MALSTAQQAVAESDSRFRVLVAGRRWGKTHLAIRELARFSRYPRRKVLYIAPTYRQAKQIVWKDLKNKLTDLKWAKRINESELMITLVNGTEIMLRSADNYDSIRGLGVDFVVFDEFADISAETWTEVVRPALSDRQGHALFIGTPKGFANWAKDLYDRGQQGMDDWASWQYTTAQGGNVTLEEIEAAKMDLDERTFNQEYNATFETYQNVIYYNFGNERVTTHLPKVEAKTVLHIGVDFNVSPLCAVVAIADSETKKLCVVDAVEIYSSNTQELCDEINARYANNKKVAYPDASGSHRHTVGDTDHNILRVNGFEVKSPKKNPPVKDRINSVNAAFLNAQGTTRLLIHPRCKKLIECLHKHTYKADTQQPDKASGYDHFPDALGYLVHSLMPIRRPGTTQQNGYYGAV